MGHLINDIVDAEYEHVLRRAKTLDRSALVLGIILTAIVAITFDKWSIGFVDGWEQAVAKSTDPWFRSNMQGMGGLVAAASMGLIIACLINGCLWGIHFLHKVRPDIASTFQVSQILPLRGMAECVLSQSILNAMLRSGGIMLLEISISRRAVLVFELRILKSMVAFTILLILLVAGVHSIM